MLIVTILFGYKLLFDPLDLCLLLGPPQQGLHPELEVQEGGVGEGGQQPRHLYSVQYSVQESVQYSLATVGRGLAPAVQRSTSLASSSRRDLQLHCREDLAWRGTQLS